ncbi:aldehyde dehydrogenase family protein [Desertimonas flava]|uniref:aldehyde dehydrogenase family protein n=1 Tax=Desertimonas flava TaxID=2064846 RepID=UPI000E34A1DF|nr:aldehyde dehydrogenase family protein [Desertimonas flava]
MSDSTGPDQPAEALARLRESARTGALDEAEARITQLSQLRRLLSEQQDVLTEALRADLGKPAVEAYTTEIGFTIGEIDHAVDHLRAWMQPIKVKTPLTFRPGSSRIVRQPLGTVLIIAPWNYPVQLTFGPLVGVLAAGNTAVLKPSELAPATAAAIAELVPRYLDERLVTVVTGGADETTALLAEPFDHIVYTGGANVAKAVMRAAAEHLTPVTLELGGKSPAIVAADADIDVAARRIAWGRFTNAGQTCVAPDYVLVAESVEDRFLGAVLRSVHDFYGENAKVSPDFGRIVNERHFDRVKGLIDAGGYDAVVTGGLTDRDQRYIAPTVLAGVDPAAAVMQEEIFGPVLPVLTVPDVDTAVQFVNDRPRPLALYVFSSDEAAAERVIERTRSGGVGINNAVFQVAIPDLPFGGIGPSGTGAYHGEAGFDRFSHRRAVYSRPTKPDPPILYPPYKRWKEAILRRVL